MAFYEEKWEDAYERKIGWTAETNSCIKFKTEIIWKKNLIISRSNLSKLAFLDTRVPDEWATTKCDTFFSIIIVNKQKLNYPAKWQQTWKLYFLTNPVGF